MAIKRTISAMDAVDLAEYWLRAADGDRDEAVADLRRYMRGRRRQDAVIAAIDFVVRRDAQKEEQ